MWPLLLALSALMPPCVCNTTALWDLPAPTNVHIDSYNMKHILKWDPVQVPDTSTPVTYSVQLHLWSNDIRLLCENIRQTQCDFTKHIKPFWRGTYAVRAELGDLWSAWVEVPDFQASIHTNIGPVQSLTLESFENKMTVSFSPPFPPVHPFKFKYWLYYWKEGSEDKTQVPLNVSTHYIMKKLEEVTVYCVQVRAQTDRIEGQMSEAKCMKTKIREYSGKELALIITFVIIGCGICASAGYMIFRKHDLLKRLLYPPIRMPYHIQEFLENLPERPEESALDLSPDEEHCNSVLVLESFCMENSQVCDDSNVVSAEKT
ncbi:interferon gamma receptor 2-like [Leptodactylus fuscus]|uniref:interferon gamma receptor 2 n=1 Tax=Leptodactylus fuscus TaxID=238119 RepID=UPI003F4ECABC